MRIRHAYKALKRKKILTFFGYFLLLTILYVLLYKILIPRVNAFGCFDDCFNFIAGHFLLKGKALYTEVFFNHQPLMAYISLALQTVTDPVNIYELVLRHRQFVMLFGFMMNFVLLWRFGWTVALFVLLYEFSKFYLFGDRFLAEGLIVYPLVFMLGILWEKLHGRMLSHTDYILTAVYAWLVIFMREPYVPLAVLAYFFILFGKSQGRQVSVVLFAVLCGLMIFSQPLGAYFFQVVAVNHQAFFVQGDQAQSLLGPNLFNIFFYPVTQFFRGEWNHFHLYLSGIATIFLLALAVYAAQLRRYLPPMMLLVLLGFANLRSTEPGTVFYAAFHMLPWFSMFVFSTVLLIRELLKKKARLALGFLAMLIVVFGYFIMSPASYIREKTDTHTEFITNYGKELQVGEAVKALSEPSETLFLDGFDDLIYWQADRLSPYPYSWYTSVMPEFTVYREAREKMFATDPPEFYYGSCPKETVETRTLPEFAKNSYTRLLQHGKPSCLFVRNDTLAGIGSDKWEKAAEVGYSPPNAVLLR